MMMAAQWYEDRAEVAFRERAKGTVEDTSGRLFRMNQASTWIGRVVRGPAGSGDRIAEMLLDRDLVMTHMVMEDGTEIPLARLRHVDDQGHAVID